MDSASNNAVQLTPQTGWRSPVVRSMVVEPELETPARTPSASSRVPTLMLVFWLLAVGLAAFRLGTGANVGFVALSVMLGAYLSYKSPAGYVSFTWQLFFFTPLFRRLFDWQSGWNASNPATLAPLVVACLGAPEIVVAILYGRANRLFLFLLAIVGLLYAYVVGLLLSDPVSATYELIEWGCPIFFAAYLVLHRDELPAIREAVKRTFLIGVLLSGIYGIVQFFHPAQWDALWLVASGMTGSMGSPEPFKIRAFGTMNSSGVYAIVLAAGLMILLSVESWKKYPAAVAGTISLLLSLVRSVWGGLVLAIVVMAFLLPRRVAARFGVAVAVLAALSLCGMLVGPVYDVVNSRAQTLGELSDDGSFNDRVNLYATAAMGVFINPIGSGLGALGNGVRLQGGGTLNLGFDSAFLAVPHSLGWIGTTLYLLGALGCLRAAIRTMDRNDTFAVTCASIAILVLSQAIFTNVFLGLTAMLFWGFLPFAMYSHTPAPAGESDAK